MKKIICIILIMLSAFSVAIASSYALDNKAKENIAELLLKNVNSTVIHEKESGHLNKIYQPFVYKNPDVYSYKKTAHLKSSSQDSESKSVLSEIIQGGVFKVGAAFITNLLVHETGHIVVANYVGASGVHLNLLNKQNGTFFLGTSIVDKIDNKSRLPFSMGGEMFTDMTFEYALQNYRKNQNLYNKSLLFFSGTDFLWYCFYAFYLSNGHPYFDPVAITKETGISKDTLFSIALAKTAINAYRVYSGQDKVIPYFTVDEDSAFLKITMPF